MLNELAVWQLQAEPALHDLTTSLNRRLNPLVPKLTTQDSQELLIIRHEQLVATHRLELSTLPLESLTEHLSFSPHLTHHHFLSLIGECLEIFYWIRNESPKTITDDDLIDLMIEVFNNRTEGSLEGTRNYLESWVRFAPPLILTKELNDDDSLFD
ncbi:hypothetical protein I6N95_16870 [Vagococcus sp. BWB3-3]|uniref:Uncharacterized protein n=1 Tax=Vagococcus allomyrinae TaxID=2794353 RepID=A0A940PAN4_9ENTE|nr:DUF6323 family protein [Vagococcus allomyrinae]MBP1042691.1 hypothetical protein [Vagococcus allomyrinae]